MVKLNIKPQDITCTKKEIELAADLVQSSAITGEELNEPTVLLCAGLQNVSARVENVLSAIRIIEILSDDLNVDKKDKNFKDNLFQKLKNSEDFRYFGIIAKVEEVTQPFIIEESILYTKLVDCDFSPGALKKFEFWGFSTIEDILLDEDDHHILKAHKFNEGELKKIKNIFMSLGIDYPLTTRQKRKIRERKNS